MKLRKFQRTDISPSEGDGSMIFSRTTDSLRSVISEHTTPTKKKKEKYGNLNNKSKQGYCDPFKRKKYNCSECVNINNKSYGFFIPRLEDYDFPTIYIYYTIILDKNY